MPEKPGRRCARCGFSAEASIRAPFEWEWYLTAERGLDLPTRGIRIPLCYSCLPRAAALQEAFFALEDYSEAERDAIYDDAHDMLDDLDLAVLAEGTPEEPRDGSRLSSS